MLLDVCRHPKLHTLNLPGQQLHKQLPKDGWISLARKLKGQEQNNHSSIQSILLSCRWCNNVRDEVLEERENVESLKSLQIEFIVDITNARINKFARMNGDNSKKHKKIKLYACHSVSSNNSHVVFLNSKF